MATTVMACGCMLHRNMLSDKYVRVELCAQHGEDAVIALRNEVWEKS